MLVFQGAYKASNLTLHENDSIEDTVTSSGDTNNSVCINKYHGEHCVSALQPLAVCSGSLDKTNVFISNNVDLNSAETEVEDLLFALDLFIKPTDECRSAVTPFLCLYTLGLCGPSNDNYRPTAAQCREIRDSTCESEWKRATGLLALAGLPPLPDCSTLKWTYV